MCLCSKLEPEYVHSPAGLLLAPLVQMFSVVTSSVTTGQRLLLYYCADEVSDLIEEKDFLDHS